MAAVPAISRPNAVALGTAAVSSTGAGLWMHATASGSDAPAGFFQYSAVAVGTAALGVFVLWHRPRNRYGLTHLAIGVLFGAVVFAAGVLSRATGPTRWLQWLAELSLAWSWIAAGALLPLWVVAIAAFPDGTFHRGWVRTATVAVAVVMPVLAVVAYLFAPPGQSPPLIQLDLSIGLAGPMAGAAEPHLLFRLASAGASILGSVAPVAAIVALFDRYRTAGIVVRQQIKWLLLGAGVSVGLQAIPVEAIGSDALRIAAQWLVVAAVPLPMAAAAVAIFKHGLWEIDVVISKGLVYALVSGVLSALFIAVGLVAGVTVGGADSRVLGAVALALLVSLLAQPLRRGLERRLARLLYGDEARGLIALAQLGDIDRASMDARELGSRVADAARAALGASWAGVWFHIPSEGSATLRPVAVSAAARGPAAVVPRAVPAALAELPGGARFDDLPVELRQFLDPLFTEPPVLVAPLTSADGLLGLIACGGRPNEGFGRDEVELLGAVARESGLALRNTRLEEELRQRLEQIEHQAAALHDSRQRLVTAQDEERRRIERDLHDGAQQQLVALAARLRRTARAGGAEVDQALDRLADEAEEAVFALQELARGIYPSLLADRGLHAALQAHVSRLPASVRIEIEPVLHGRRFDPELEAAFYFVALEAITNAVKHAPGAQLIISLRGDPHKNTVILEVHDDGPGFNGPAKVRGTGLQNMADRIDAFGGVFSVSTAPGGGTWVRAEVRETANVTDITGREATP